MSLQCGHSPKAVENCLEGLACANQKKPLQCGHSPKAVENPKTPIVNGQWPVNTPMDDVLQCGHSPKAVENAWAAPGCEAVR